MSYLRATLISSLLGGETKASRAALADRADRADKAVEEWQKGWPERSKKPNPIVFSIPGKKYFPPTIPLPLLKERVKKDEEKR